jgi:hypothetical protein
MLATALTPIRYDRRTDQIEIAGPRREGHASPTVRYVNGAGFEVVTRQVLGVRRRRAVDHNAVVHCDDPDVGGYYLATLVERVG